MEKKNPVLEPILSGVNYMLPVVVAGGIMLGISFLVDDITINPELYGTNLPLAAFFNVNGNTLFSFMLPVFCAGLAYYIAGKSAIPAALMAGALAREGDSSFLGALLLGFVVGYIVIGLAKVFDKLPETFTILKDLLLIPLVSALLTAVVTYFLVEPVVGSLNILMNNGLQSMSGSSKVILGAVLAAMQSADMGGPINKTGYLFATAALANGEYSLMSAVLAGALIPPYVTGISTLLFKNKFTKVEKGQGITNLIMGLAGISEGGIPFLLKDPLRVGTACIIGSAIAGGGSILFGCSVMAPFGGFFILSLNSNPLGFVISVLLGVVTGIIILGITKKNIEVDETNLVQVEG